MSEKTFQAKLTEDEIEAALKALATQIACYSINDEKYERFNYLAKRLLKIKKGDIELETETQPENNSPAETKAQGWA